MDLTRKLVTRIVDLLAATTFPLAVPFLYIASSQRSKLRIARRLQDGINVTVLRNNFYEPSSGRLSGNPARHANCPASTWIWLSKLTR